MSSCGYGKITFTNGEIMQGKFDNISFSKGRKTYQNGTTEDGDFEDGLLKKGLRIFSDKITEYGEFDKNGSLIRGLRVRDNNISEEGHFQDGVLKKGKRTLADRSMEEGEFEDRCLKSGKAISKNSECYVENSQFTRMVTSKKDGTVIDTIFENDSVHTFINGIRTEDPPNVLITFGINYNRKMQKRIKKN